MRRRDYLRATLATLGGLLSPWRTPHAKASTSSADQVVGSGFGHWINPNQLPAFVYQKPLVPETPRHWHLFGNRAIQVLARTDGNLGLFEERQGMRWLVQADSSGRYPHTLLRTVIPDGSERRWDSHDPDRQVFSGNAHTLKKHRHGLGLEREVMVPEGERAYVLIRVRVRLDDTALPQRIDLTEQWPLAPRFLKTWQSEPERAAAARQVSYRTWVEPASALDGAQGSGAKVSAIVWAQEQFAPSDALFGDPRTLGLAIIGQRHGSMSHSLPRDRAHPILSATCKVDLEPGEQVEVWFQFGCLETQALSANPKDQRQAHLNALRGRLPRPVDAESTDLSKVPLGPAGAAASAVAPEFAWHGAALTGAANRDEVLGGHTLNQGSVYGFVLGANAAARDQLQHALPLVYTEPDLALSVLCNTCAWATPQGDLPYALGGDKRPMTDLLQPSDQNLWAFWLAAEYAAATGDLAAFDQPLAYHPMYQAEPVTLATHLLRQLDFFQQGIGEGARGHVRIRNADWNDMVLNQPGMDRDAMIERGSSVLNSAMASWVLSIFAPLLRRLGQREGAAQAVNLAERYRRRGAQAWNGRWFDRAYTPEGEAIGRTACWLEVQPWAILCGAASPAQGGQVLDYIDAHHRRGSPLGARILWPIDPRGNPHMDRPGEGTQGGIWYAINMTLIWSAARLRPKMAWDEWHRMRLQNHSVHYPDAWAGTLSGPDAWNGPEASRPGATWITDAFAMQDFPVANLHVHAQPLLAYQRLHGVTPTAAGTLAAPSALGTLRAR